MLHALCEASCLCKPALRPGLAEPRQPPAPDGRSSRSEPATQVAGSQALPWRTPLPEDSPAFPRFPSHQQRLGTPLAATARPPRWGPATPGTPLSATQRPRLAAGAANVAVLLRRANRAGDLRADRYLENTHCEGSVLLQLVVGAVLGLGRLPRQPVFVPPAAHVLRENSRVTRGRDSKGRPTALRGSGPRGMPTTFSQGTVRSPAPSPRCLRRGVCTPAPGAPRSRGPASSPA